MPNWVFNKLTLTGPEDDLQAIKERLRRVNPETGEIEPLSFQQLAPRPAEETDWYNWQVKHWGTKWDAAYPGCFEEPGSLTYEFQTAWSPPMPVLQALVTAYPWINFTFEYEEEQGWGGNIVVEKGELLSHEEYDIPSSHADFIVRGGECWCNPHEPMFEDCLVHHVEATEGLAPEVFEAAKALAFGWEGTLEELLTAAGNL